MKAKTEDTKDKSLSYKRKLEILLERTQLSYLEILFYCNPTNKIFAISYAADCAKNGNINDLQLFFVFKIFDKIIVNLESKRFILSNAIKSGNIEIVDFLTSQFKDLLNFPDIDGNTPVMQATKLDQCKIVVLLCQKGADLNIPDNKNFTPLSCAQKQKNQKMICIISQAIANKNTKKSDEKSSATTNPQTTNVREDYNDSEWDNIDIEEDKINEEFEMLMPEATTEQREDSQESRSFASKLEAERKVEGSNHSLAK